MEARGWPLSDKFYLTITIPVKLAFNDPILKYMGEACL